MKKLFRWFTRPVRRVYHTSTATYEILRLFVMSALVIAGISGLVEGALEMVLAVAAGLAVTVYVDSEVRKNETD